MESLRTHNVILLDEAAEAERVDISELCAEDIEEKLQAAGNDCARMARRECVARLLAIYSARRAEHAPLTEADKLQAARASAAAIEAFCYRSKPLALESNRF